MATYEDLDGKTVVVTGANGGMGMAITATLSEAGATVIAADLQSEIHPDLASYASVRYCQTDVSSEPAVAEMVAKALALGGVLHCAVNAAGIEFENQRLHESRVEDFDRLMQVNLRGLFLCMKHELQAMLAGGGGSLVNLASTTSFQPVNKQPIYGASKHGVLGLTRQAAMDYGGDGIRVNGIAPGNIDTPMLRGALDRRGVEGAMVEKRMLMGRFGTAAEIAQAALWLCSDASAFTTGHILSVEGGMLLG